MNRTGTWDGEGCDTYWKACLFFKKRELAGLPLKVPKAKKAKTTAAGGSTGAAAGGKAAGAKAADDLLNTSDVVLPGEDKGNVAVYMTCDEVRKALRAIIAKGVSQAALARTLSTMYPADGEKKVSPANLRYFLGRNGPLDGNTNSSYYAGYCLFEKLRIKEGKPKSGWREEMEGVHGRGGVDVENNSNGSYCVRIDDSLFIDKYGKMRWERGGGYRL